MMKENVIESQVHLVRGTDRLSNGISLKAAFSDEIYRQYFRVKNREKEFKELERMYKSQK